MLFKDEVDGRWASDEVIIAYADILGYKAFISKINKDVNTLRTFEELIYQATVGLTETGLQSVPPEHAELAKKVFSAVKIRVASDNVLFLLPAGSVMVEGSTVPSKQRDRALQYCFETLFNVMSHCCCRIIAFTGCPLRGAIAMGFHYESERQNFLFAVSEALNNAVVLEKEAKRPRILLSTKVSECLHGISYPHTDQFFYKDESGDHCFDWYAGVVQLPLEMRRTMLKQIGKALLGNALNNRSDREVMSKLIYFIKYHNRKVSDSAVQCPDAAIDLAPLENLL